MYYSNGNYEAFARPLKPAGVDDKRAYLVGSGLASLAAAIFLVRDAQMAGDRITILEADPVPGGAMDGRRYADRGFVIRGGREMENHFECLWDAFRTIPSPRIEGASVLDEFYWLNKEDPNSSLQRATVSRGEDAHTDGKFTLNKLAQKDIVKLFLARNSELEYKSIRDVMGDDFFASNFWLYWRSMFAFNPWHSALEMKLYVQRFIHHIHGLPDFSALKFTKFNQYESLILPAVAWLKDQGVVFQYDTTVTDVAFDVSASAKVATRIEWTRGGIPDGLDLTENDLVFVTNGSCTQNATLGTQTTVPTMDTENKGSWALWRKIAAQDPSFGRPDVFCTNPAESNWESATVTTLDTKIPPYIEKICKRDPFSGRVVTGGIVTAKDSAWLLSWTVNRQPHFAEQPADQLVVWVYGLFTDVPGDFVKKPMKECTGEEIAQEWLYHMGVPVEEIIELAAHSANTVPCMMPYITSFFTPRGKGDRPDVVPAGSVNFAFLGQFAETPDDTIFTTEYSVRTGMEAVYTLLNVDRGVPEVFASRYDVREWMKATACLNDHEPLQLPIPRPVMKWLGKKLGKTVIPDYLRTYGLIK